MDREECEHNLGIVVKWLRGTFYLICRACGQDTRQRVSPAASKLN